MRIRQPRYSKEEAARRCDEIYDRDIRPQVEPHRIGEVVAKDLDTGAWEVDPDQDTAAARLEARRPDAQIMVMRVGSTLYHSISSRAPKDSSMIIGTVTYNSYLPIRARMQDASQYAHRRSRGDLH